MSTTAQSFSLSNFNNYCNILAKQDKHIMAIVEKYGYPNPVLRKPNFQSLVHIILEQQVSIASAKAAFLKLKTACNGTITATKVIAMTDDELKTCYLSRQKIIYVKDLANAIATKKLVLTKLAALTDDAVRAQLIAIKGIGHWTADVYLMFCLQRLNLFPIGDIALVNSIKHELGLPTTTTKEEILTIAQQWQPLCSVATFIFWQAYIVRKGIKIDF